MTDIIKDLIKGKVSDPATGKKLSIPIKKILIDSGVINQIAPFCEKHSLGKRAAIISDENTHLAAGAEVERHLSLNHFEVFSIVMPADLNADDANVEALMPYISSSDFAIAVGSGTISDLTKYVTHKLGKEYICVPTAPSVNGYSSANASIEINGIKKTLPAHLPLAIFMDIDVQVQAPYRLIVSGLGDALARTTAQGDWLMSHLLLNTPYNQFAFDILKEDEEKLFANAEKLLQNDYETILSLCRLSILSGLGMYICGGSYPASQGEHLIHHYMEMMFEGKYPHTFHGEQIAVTSITSARLQEEVLLIDHLQINPTYYYEKPLLTHFGAEKGTQFLAEVEKKEISADKAKEINARLAKEWHEIKKQILAIHIPSKALEDIIKKIKGPYTYKHLGWQHTDYQAAITHSLYTRDRFTFLDLAMIAKREI